MTQDTGVIPGTEARRPDLRKGTAKRAPRDDVAAVAEVLERTYGQGQRLAADLLTATAAIVESNRELAARTSGYLAFTVIAEEFEAEAKRAKADGSESALIVARVSEAHAALLRKALTQGVPQ